MKTVTGTLTTNGLTVNYKGNIFEHENDPDNRYDDAEITSITDAQGRRVFVDVDDLINGVYADMEAKDNHEAWQRYAFQDFEAELNDRVVSISAEDKTEHILGVIEYDQDELEAIFPGSFDLKRKVRSATYSQPAEYRSEGKVTLESWFNEFMDKNVARTLFERAQASQKHIKIID